MMTMVTMMLMMMMKLRRILAAISATSTTKNPATEVAAPSDGLCHGNFKLGIEIRERMLLSSAAFVAVFVGNSVALAAAIAASASIVRHRDGGGHAELDAVDSLHRILASERRCYSRPRFRPRKARRLARRYFHRFEGHGIIIVVVPLLLLRSGRKVARAAGARAGSTSPTVTIAITDDEALSTNVDDDFSSSSSSVVAGFYVVAVGRGALGMQRGSCGGRDGVRGSGETPELRVDVVAHHDANGGCARWKIPQDCQVVCPVVHFVCARTQKGLSVAGFSDDDDDGVVVVVVVEASATSSSSPTKHRSPRPTSKRTPQYRHG